MNITKLQQEIKTAEEALNRMKEQLKEEEKKNDKDFYPNSLVLPFHVNKCIKVVDGHEYELDFAFEWSKTPQGHTYWSKKRDGVLPITDEDKITLLRWCVNYYRAQEKK